MTSLFQRHQAASFGKYPFGGGLSGIFVSKVSPGMRIIFGGIKLQFPGCDKSEKWENFRNIGTIFCNRKSTQMWEPLRKGAGTGSAAGCGRRGVQIPLPPHP